MKKIIIDGQNIESRTDFFNLLSEQFAHPEFTPKNLDALNDMLGEINGSDYELILEHSNSLLKLLGNHYYYKMLQVFDDNHIEITLTR